MTPVERLMRRVVRDGDCWRVTGPLRKDGYSQIEISGKKVLGHRLTYEHFAGPIPDGLVLDHVWERGCKFRSCVNPAHLEPVTHSENVRRGTQAERTRARFDAFWNNRTHCDHGHDLAEVGIDTEPATGHRKCRACHLKQRSETHRRAKADPVRAARIRQQNRRAQARARAKKAAA